MLLFFLLAGAANVGVPRTCTPDVNRKLAKLLSERPGRPVDNVMVCGVSTGSSHTQRGGPHGDHQMIPVLVTLPDRTTRQIEIVTNDALDGKITAPSRASIFAYGQAFFDRTGRYAAGLHETHCSTHHGADNGWIVVNGARFPSGC